jgi:hypothetical protein
MLFGEGAARDIEYAGKLAPKQRIVKIVKSEGEDCAVGEIDRRIRR